MKSVKSFINEFKEFLLGSTFVDVAIGLLIAGAVKDVATSFTDSFVTPIILKLLSILGINADAGSATTVFGVDFYIGNFITALISFIIIMFVAFTILQAYAKMKEAFAKSNAEDEEEVEIALSNEEKILLEIRDLLKEQNSTDEK
ncbi:MscL family protein [Mollicutes bacterium LVI A0078]|nr:MscL family protein [Mollicutes bacterium LVI A0075]WOO91483.1 MscL family protein [Mollicutes bacterium LVI A0078]